MSALIYRTLWQHLDAAQPHGACLPRNTLLKVVSWNIDFATPAPGERSAAALEYLERTFGEQPGQLAVILQEVCQESVKQILHARWVQQNFVVVGYDLPTPLQAGTTARYFTLAMIPIGLRVERSFRMPFPSRMRRDALFVDIPVCSSPGAKGKDMLRLCTTHLESLGSGAPLRKRQLNMIAYKLREYGEASGVVAGLLGGDMNAILDAEHALQEQVGLKDAWEDELPAHAQHSEGEVSTGGPEGHTWGYQSGNTPFPPQRFDKFLYNGSVETVPLSEAPGFGRRIGRLGVGLKVEIPGAQPLWASDHFGIAVGIKVGD